MTVNGLRTAILFVLLAALAAATPAGAAVRKPDLAVGSLAGVPRSVSPGDALALRVTIVNKGGGRAGASRLALYLSRDARSLKGDIRLGGGKVSALKGRKKQAARASVT